MEFLCDFDFKIKHINGKENKVVDALSRKVQEMHVESLSIFQSYLTQHIDNHIAGDELYEQVKDKLQQQSLERDMRDINWKKMDLLLIKEEFIFQMQQI